MDRRGFIVSITGVLLAAPFLVQAQQQAGKIPRIGVLAPAQISEAFKDAFRSGLRDHGYIEGRNVLIEWREGEAQAERMAALATALVRLGVDVIVASGTSAVQASKSATTAIPIVMAPAADPVRSGFAVSLGRPGGNITGVSSTAAELSGKRLQLLREVVPTLARVTILVNKRDSLFAELFVEENQAAARALGIQLHVMPVEQPKDLADAFSAIKKERTGALVMQPIFPVPARQVAELALQHGLPSISDPVAFPEAGGLMSYGATRAGMYRHAATYVSKILKGSRPADLPIEQPTKFELVVNMKTARALGLSIPPSLMLRVDRVIE